MKVLMLHLSDIHFIESNSFTLDNVRLMIKAIRVSVDDISTVFVIVSGDLSYSGKKSQFKEFSKFINTLKGELKDAFFIANIEIFVVPGNHDVDYAHGELNRDSLEKIYKDRSYDSELSKEISKQEEFYKCASKYGCFRKKELVSQKKIKCDGKTVLVNLINTAAFSSLEEDQGFHYLGKSDIKKLREQQNADFVFSVMHHPHQWFSDIMCNELEEVLYGCSDMIFVGHKHYEKSLNIDDSKTSVHVLSGGMLSNCGNWNGSEFHVCILNVNNRIITVKKYRLNETNSIYLEYDKILNMSLSCNRVDCLGLALVHDTMEKLICVDKHSITDSFIKYFVFPTLEEEMINKAASNGTSDITSIETFLRKLLNEKKIIITGHSDSGKTVLSKFIFQQLAKTKTTVFIEGKNVNANCERTIRFAFEELYGEENVKYELFKQADKEDKAIIIDDVDAIKSSIREDFVKYVNEYFGYIVETCQQEIELDIKTRLQNKRSNRNYSIYKIAPFYFYKRKELVTKLINILSNESTAVKEEIITTLCDALARQKLLYNWNPDFIVQFTRYYYNNIGESYKNDGDTFSKVFEANIVLLIKPYAGRISVDKILIVLDKIAYGAYLNKESPISHDTVCKIINSYNEEYDANIDVRKFLNLLIDSKIIKEAKNGGYLFYETMYLAYFTARELKRRCIEEGDLEQIKYVIEHAYKRINADILLFVTYITDNLNIIKMIMDLAEKSIEKWEEFSLDPINISYLSQDANFRIKPFDEKDREKEEKSRIEAEKNEARYMSKKDEESIFDDSDEINFFHELIRGIALLTVLSRTLPSFEHLMKKVDKVRCVNLIYTMPLKIFNAWALEIDRNCSDIIREIKDFHEWEYRKDKPKEKKLTDDRAVDFLQWESISLLLELMNVATSNAVRDNTWKFIDNYKFADEMTYGVEHLMGLGKQNNIDKFIAEADRLIKSSSRQLGVSMVKRVTRNVMVNSRKIRFDQIQKLNAKIFKDALKKEPFLIEKDKNRKKY